VRQCFNCESFGHSSNFCGKPPKCVKCNQPHATKDCMKFNSTPPKCVNCGGEHPANFSG
jgi:PAX-interacting protein 1